MSKIYKKHELPIYVNDLEPDFIYRIGDFTILFNEDSHELEISTSHASKHLKIRPKTDNRIIVSAYR